MRKICKKVKKSLRSVQAFNPCRTTLCNRGCASAAGTPAEAYAKQHASDGNHSAALATN